MSESMTTNEKTPGVEYEGKSLAKYLVEDIMPKINHPDPLNCLISTITLVS